MNLFVVGPRALSDWILRLIKAAQDELLEFTPPIALKLTDHSENCDAVVCEAHEYEHVRSQKVYAGRPFLCVVGEGPVGEGRESAQTPQETLLLWAADEGESGAERARFRDAARTIFLRCHLQAFQRTLAGPFSHDVKGALSVVSLSRQLLESGGDGRQVATRLGRVDSRIAMALFDIEARSLCLSGAWPPSVGTTPLGAPGIEEIVDWFARTQGERKLEATPQVLDEMRRAPSWMSVALAGCLEGVTRLTRGDVEIATPKQEGDSLFVRVRGGSADMGEIQMDRLLEPERWALLPAESMPYRLGTAALLVGAAHGSVSGRVEAGSLIVEMRLP
jgi:hypothetical protein